MERARRTRKRRSDWQGRSTVIATKLTDPELIELIRVTTANGGNRAAVIRKGLTAIGAIGKEVNASV